MKKSLNILYINHYAGSPNYGMEIRPYELAKRWVKKGNYVRIVAAKYTHLRGKNPSVEKENIEGIEYYWLSTPKYEKNNIFRFWNILVFLYRLYTQKKKYLKGFNPDVVIASSTYPMDIFPAKNIAKKYNAKLIFELHDLWPLSLYELGAFTPKNPFAKWVQYAEDYYCKYSDKVVSILPKTKDYLVSRGMEEHKFEYISNGVNSKQISNKPLPKDIKDKLDKIKLNYKFLIGYTGTLNTANNLELLLNTEIPSDTAIVLFGSGPNKEKLESIVRNKKAKYIFFMGRVSPDEVSDALNYLDVLYKGLPHKNIYKYGISSIKISEYMLSAKPVVHAAQNNANDLIKEVECGLSAPPDSTEELAKAIIKLKNMTSEEREEMGERGRKHVIENYDYDVLADKFLEVIKN